MRAGRRSMPSFAPVVIRTTDRESGAAPAIGYSIPPLWGDDSFNVAAGMAKPAYAAAYIRGNMPFSVRYQDPVLSEQQAWDVAAYMISKPRPSAPPEAAPRLRIGAGPGQCRASSKLKPT